MAWGRREQMVLTVEGMSCGKCEGRVRLAAERVPGVKAATVEQGRASLWVKPGTDPAAVVASLDEEGYRAEPQSPPG